MRFERLLSSEAPPATLLGSLFLLLVGAGPWSVDAWLSAGAERRK